MLSNSEVLQLLDGSFWLDCPVIRLLDEERTETLNGSGFIRQRVDGGFEFRMYSAQRATGEALHRLFAGAAGPSDLGAEMGR
jgi:hypothetical protein